MQLRNENIRFIIIIIMPCDGHVRFGRCYFAPFVFIIFCWFYLVISLSCIPFVGVGKYRLSTIFSPFLDSRRFGCLFSSRVAGHRDVLQASGSVAKYSLVCICYRCATGARRGRPSIPY